MAGRNVIQGYFPNGVTSRASAAAAVQAKTGPPAWVQAAIARCGSQDPIVQPKAPTSNPPVPPPPPASRNAVVLPPAFANLPASGGSPLPAAVRQKMESSFGASFADVRIHIGPHAQAIGALAFTHGSHIHFAPGHYNPATRVGLEILGHELMHVVQQRSGRVRNPFASGVAIIHDRVMDAEAARVSRSIVQRSSSAVAATPVLSFSAVRQANQEGPAGNFRRKRKWKVDNPVQGIILQKIERAFDVQTTSDLTTTLTGSQIDSYITNAASKAFATVGSYYELWQVASDGTVSDENADTFGLCSIIPDTTSTDTTVGKYTIKGTAWFYATTKDPATDLGMDRTSVDIAGGLFSSTSLPSGLPSSTTSGPVTYTVLVEWDTRSSGRDSRFRNNYSIVTTS